MRKGTTGGPSKPKGIAGNQNFRLSQGGRRHRRCRDLREPRRKLGVCGKPRTFGWEGWEQWRVTGSVGSWISFWELASRESAYISSLFLLPIYKRTPPPQKKKNYPPLTLNYILIQHETLSKPNEPGQAPQRCKNGTLAMINRAVLV